MSNERALANQPLFPGIKLETFYRIREGGFHITNFKPFTSDRASSIIDKVTSSQPLTSLCSAYPQWYQRLPEYKGQPAYNFYHDPLNLKLKAIKDEIAGIDPRGWAEEKLGKKNRNAELHMAAVLLYTNALSHEVVERDYDQSRWLEVVTQLDKIVANPENKPNLEEAVASLEDFQRAFYVFNKDRITKDPTYLEQKSLEYIMADGLILGIHPLVVAQMVREALIPHSHPDGEMAGNFAVQRALYITETLINGRNPNTPVEYSISLFPIRPKPVYKEPTPEEWAAQQRKVSARIAYINAMERLRGASDWHADDKLALQNKSEREFEALWRENAFEGSEAKFKDQFRYVNLGNDAKAEKLYRELVGTAAFS